MIERERGKAYFQKNKVHIYKKLLNVYSWNAIKRIKNQSSHMVDEMYMRYPYDKYCSPYFNYLCLKYGVRQNAYLYQECFDAGMLAYMYSICRCSIMKDRDDSEHIKAYIWKITKIYFKAAMEISNDSKNLCKENGFRQVNCSEDYRV